MSGHGFTSAFARQLDSYVEFKTSMGCYGSSRVWYLQRFDAYCSEHQLEVFDQETVETWVAARLASSGRYRSWMSYIRDFGRWLHTHGDADAYVLSDKWQAGFVPAHPYLLTTAEIEAFFLAATRLETSSPWQWQAVAFFTLMHSCGLRTGEVRDLLTKHVDLAGRHLEIVSAKGNRSRSLPITAEIADILADCDDASTSCLGRARGPFFMSSTGNPVTAAPVGVIFNRIWDHAGLPRPAGRQRPRPYDFRHHFAYVNIQRWMSQGIDTTAMLPYLATYMGHASVDSTYYYIHTSPDFMTSYAHITSQSEALLPEVGFE